MIVYSLFYSTFTSPIGLIEIEASQEAVFRLDFVPYERHPSCKSSFLEKIVTQLEEYFLGQRKTFNIPVSFSGTSFQCSVWKELQSIPYGKTIAYRQLAEAIGTPKATRAVGAANGRNPIAIIVPCHRVIGSDGSLVGYGGGLWRKEWLLNHEKENS